jgi:hypothetical protein
MNFMKKKHLLITAAALLAIIGPVYFGARSADRVDATAPSPTAVSGSQSSVRADRVEVVHFHGATQCWSCKTVGDFALKTVKERFPDEYADGTVVFMDIDGSKPANQAIIQKYQATASSLFLNAVTDGQDRIEEDAAVWRLIYNEKKFSEYLEGRIRQLLGR